MFGASLRSLLLHGDRPEVLPCFLHGTVPMSRLIIAYWNQFRNVFFLIDRNILEIGTLKIIIA